MTIKTSCPTLSHRTHLRNIHSLKIPIVWWAITLASKIWIIIAFNSSNNYRTVEGSVETSIYTKICKLNSSIISVIMSTIREVIFRSNRTKIILTLHRAAQQTRTTKISMELIHKMAKMIMVIDSLLIKIRV